MKNSHTENIHITSRTRKNDEFYALFLFLSTFPHSKDVNLVSRVIYIFLTYLFFIRRKHNTLFRIMAYFLL